MVDINLQKLFRKTFLKTLQGRCFAIRFMHKKIADPTFTGMELIKMVLFFTCHQEDISVWISRIVLKPPVEAHSGPSQASKTDLFARIVNSFILMLLTIFAKRFIGDVWRVLTCSLGLCPALMQTMESVLQPMSKLNQFWDMQIWSNKYVNMLKL